MERIPLHIARFFGLVFIQLFLLKNIGFYNLSTPYIYILFILLLPFKTPNLVLYTLAFCCGLTIDVFNDTLGLHVLACTVLAFGRILFLNLTISNDSLETEPEPSLSIMGARWFLLYGLLMAFLHHLTLFTFELFSLSKLGGTLLRSILSAFFTLFLMLVISLVFYSKKTR
jgi:rod shape-determining protein MreD